MDDLKKALAGSTAQIVLPDDAEYNSLIDRWSEAAILPAAAIILPTTAQEISTTIKHARTNNIPFTTAGGRHSTSAASSIAAPGIVIDLRRMRNVTIDPTKKIITAQGGCIWQDVDEAAAKYGLATPGGTVNHTGIGGLTLGGGYGWLSGRYGLVIDVLLSVTMVLADGSIVTCSAEENEDLFWAIRGCGASFGVAVEFTYQGFEQENHVWGGLMVFTPDKLAGVVEFANKLHKENDGDQGLLFGFSAPPPMNLPVVLAAVFYNGPEEKAKVFFKDLLELGPVMDQTCMMPYEKMNGSLNAAAVPGGRRTGGGSVFACPLDVGFVQEVFDRFGGLIKEHEGTNESAVLFELEPYGKIVETSNEAMAFGNRGEYYNFTCMFKWYDPALDNTLRTFSRKLNEFVRERGGTMGMKGVGVYTNNVDYPSVPQKMFGANTARLVELKKKYDPQNLFFRWHNIVPWYRSAS